jgi:hypothetical protein
VLLASSTITNHRRWILSIFINASIEWIANLAVNDLMTKDRKLTACSAPPANFSAVRRFVVGRSWNDIEEFDRRFSPLTVEQYLRICAGFAMANIAECLAVSVLRDLGLKEGGMQRE